LETFVKKSEVAYEKLQCTL